MKLKKILLEEVAAKKFEELLHNIQQHFPKIEDRLIDLGVAKEKTIKAVHELISIVGKNNYYSEKELDELFDSWIGHIEGAIRIYLESEHKDLMYSKIEKTLHYAIDAGLETYQRKLTAIKGFIEMEKEPDPRKRVALSDKLLSRFKL